MIHFEHCPIDVNYFHLRLVIDKIFLFFEDIQGDTRYTKIFKVILGYCFTVYNPFSFYTDSALRPLAFLPPDSTRHDSR